MLVTSKSLYEKSSKKKKQKRIKTIVVPELDAIGVFFPFRTIVILFAFLVSPMTGVAAENTVVSLILWILGNKRGISRYIYLLEL